MEAGVAFRPNALLLHRRGVRAAPVCPHCCQVCYWYTRHHDSGQPACWDWDKSVGRTTSNVYQPHNVPVLLRTKTMQMAGAAASGGGGSGGSDVGTPATGTAAPGPSLATAVPAPTPPAPVLSVPLTYEWEDTVVLRGHTGKDWVQSFALLPGGQLASGSSDGKVRLWDAARGTPVPTAVLDEFGGLVFALTALPDGRRLAVGVSSSFGRAGTIVVWDTGVVPANLGATVECSSGVQSLAVLRDGRLAFSCKDNGVRLEGDVTLGVTHLPCWRWRCCLTAP